MAEKETVAPKAKETAKPKIYAKIGDILKDIEPISKARRNTQQGYSFRGVEDAMNMLSPILAKHGVFPSTARIEDVRSDEVQSKTGTVGYHYVRRYTFAFFADDGSFIETTVDGEAIDYGDKASNKAYSTAYREAFWKIFIVPFETDDIENHDHELNSSKPASKLKADNPVIAKYKKQMESAKSIAELKTIWGNMPISAKDLLTGTRDEMKAILDTESNYVQDEKD